MLVKELLKESVNDDHDEIEKSIKKHIFPSSIDHKHVDNERGHNYGGIHTDLSLERHADTAVSKLKDEHPKYNFEHEHIRDSRGNHKGYRISYELKKSTSKPHEQTPEERRREQEQENKNDTQRKNNKGEY